MPVSKFKEKQTGFDENQLLKLAKDDRGIDPDKFPYPNMESYGLGKYIRKYGFYPRNLNLYISFSHGIYLYASKVNNAEFIYSSKYHFINSPRLAHLFDDLKDKKIYFLFSPCVFYRRKNKIIPVKNANGTLAFPSHMTEDTEEKSNINDYISDLKKLPAEFHPVDICLYWLDIIKGRHKIFLENGFRVFTAGNMFNGFFIERFYSILKNYKYTTANAESSALFYSVEMGIPHFIYGNKPEYYFTENNSFYRQGVFDFHKKDEYFDKVIDLFSFPNIEITKEKEAIVKYELGMNDGISRIKMCSILYLSLFEYILTNFIPIIKNFIWVLVVRRLKKRN